MGKKIRRLCLKISRKKKYMKNKALVNFILQHERKVDIDFSKIKIPPFFNCLKDNQTTEFSETPLPKIDFQLHFNLLEPSTRETSTASDDISEFNNINQF